MTLMISLGLVRFLLQLCKWAMEIKPTKAPFLGKQPLFSTSSHYNRIACR